MILLSRKVNFNQIPQKTKDKKPDPCKSNLVFFRYGNHFIDWNRAERTLLSNIDREICKLP